MTCPRPYKQSITCYPVYITATEILEREALFYKKAAQHMDIVNLSRWGPIVDDLWACWTLGKK